MVLCGHSAYAQHPYFYTLHDDNGLPSNEVYQLQQDGFGYMWIGCNAGLYRYDGYKFQGYNNTKQNSIAISGLKVSPTQQMYCQNFGGQIFYIKNDSLLLFMDLKERTRAHPPYTIDKQGNIWIGLPEGILKRDINGKEELLFKGQLYINDIKPYDDGSIYVSDIAKGLVHIYKDNSGTYQCKKIAGVPEAFTNSRTTIETKGDHIYALSTTNAERNYFITSIQRDTARLIKYIPKNSIAEFIFSLTLVEDKLWMGTSSGAYCIKLDGTMEQSYFPGEKISDIVVDCEGNLWFSTLQNGIFIVPNMHLSSITEFNSPLKDNHITALKAIAPGKVLIGTYSGDIYKYTLENRQLTLLPKSPNTAYGNVTSFIQYNLNTIIASRGAISIIDLEKGTDRNHLSLYVRDMALAHDTIFFVSSEIIGSIGPLSGLASGKYYAKDVRRIAGKKICFDTAEQLMWVTLNDGLATVEHNNFSPYHISGKPVFANVLHSDYRGLWAGTVSDGVYNIQHKQPKLHLDNEKGLIGNNVRCIISEHDTVYIATDICINVYYPNGTFAYLDYTDGINAKEITSLAITNNILFIGTIRGVFYLPVSTQFTNNVQPHIRITSVSIDGINQPTDKPIELAWNSKDILIQFSSATLRSRGKSAYLYRIAGFQNEWRKLDGNINYVRLNHLPSGSYTFEVKAMNEDGVPSGDTATITMTVNAPFWQHIWFYGLVAILGSSVVALLSLVRIRQIKEKANIRNQVATSQLTALKAQMNPHFMYNTLNSIQDLILQNDIKSTNYYLSRYSTLTRKILESSESNEIELSEELEILQLYMELEQLRFGDDFKYTVTVSEQLDKSRISIPSMIIQPFVENAIKHGLLHKRGEKLLDVSFEKTGTGLTCIIKDNGIGRKKAAEIKQRSPLGHKSFATKATERRLELINIGRRNKIKLTITDLEDNGTAAGTMVRIDIPLQ